MRSGHRTLLFLAGRYEAETMEESFQALLASTRELCEYAKAKGNMPVLCEVFDYDIAKKSLIGPVDRVNATQRRSVRSMIILA